MLVPDRLVDIDLNPRLLQSLLKDYVPHTKHPFSNPLDLLYVLSTVKTHKLLSEWAPEPLNGNLMDSWKSAVDSWVNRLLTLASSNLQDKCWAGICLLGITSQECSPERFLSSCDVWLNKLLSQIQLPAASHFVKVASCASISDLFTRLSGFENVKKDATSHATKVIPLVLKLLIEDSSSVVLEESARLICTLIDFFPLSVQRHYDSVEVAIVSKLLLGPGCASVLQKLSYTLSLLPKSRGDADSWSLLMDKILLCMNNLLTAAALHGPEEEARSTKTMRALLPSGKEPPAPLGGSTIFEQILDLSARKPERLLGSRISALMQCCCNLLTNPYPAMVSVPIRGIISVAERVLMIDSSLLASSYEFMTPMKPEFICSEIPLLQSHSLEILAAVVEGLRSQTLPHVASIIQLLNEFLRRNKFPDLRRKVYLVLKDLLMSMGTGISIHVSQDIVNNVFIDLDIIADENFGESASTQIKAQTDSRKKKRKHSSIEKSIQEQPASDALEIEIPPKHTPISLRIAALETLETLLTVSGSFRAESWRGNVDWLLINLATNACKRGCYEEERFLLLSDPTHTWTDFQLAALHSLLASLLSPSRVRPPHLAQSLKLFRRGAQEMGTKLAKYCGYALLALEVLIHPRALPLLDLHSSPDDYKFQSHRQLSTYHIGTSGEGQGEPESEEDYLNEIWLSNDDDMKIQDVEMQQIADNTERAAATRDPSINKLPSVKVASVSPVFEKNVAIVSASNDNHIGGKNDQMLESQVRNTKGQRAEDISPVAAVDVHLDAHSVESEQVSTKAPSVETNTTMKIGLSEGIQGARSIPEQHAAETSHDRLNAIVERISATDTQTARRKGMGFESDDELSTESIPDIVDGDPDSD